MIDSRITEGLAVVSAGYIKRWLERNVYDNIPASDIGQKIAALDRGWKYGIELGLNLLTALFSRIQTGKSYPLNVLKQVGLDLAPEVSSRIIYEPGEAKCAAPGVKDNNEFARVLQELDKEVLAELLTWLHGLDPDRKTRILTFLSRVSKEGIAEISKLESPVKEYLIELLDMIERQ